MSRGRDAPVNKDKLAFFKGLGVQVANENGLVIEGITYRKNLSH